MSVASSTIASPSRSSSQMVRLAPYLVEALCELTRAVRDKTHSQNEVGGLLFGSSDDGTISVEALKTFKDSGPRSDLARRERMEKAFQAAMTQATSDPEFSSYQLLGWFSLRGSGGLIHADADFHNHHFKSSDDVALIVWREGDTQITAEVYSSPDGGKLTTEDYRWSSVRLSTEMRRVSQPVDLVMRARLNEDSYLRAYATTDREERRDEWKKIASAAKRSFLSLLPKGNGSGSLLGNRPIASEPRRTIAPTPKPAFESNILFRQTEATMPAPQIAPRMPVPESISRPAIAAQPEPVTTRAMIPRPAVPEISGLPMVINRHPPRRKGTPWLSMAMVFIVFSGITFAFLAFKGLGSDSGKLSQIMRVIFPGSDLDLRAEGRGDRLLVTWNRKNQVVQSAAMAMLSVSDGPRHFEKKLDPAQVAEGSVLYRPVTGDVTFELKVFGTDQSSIAVDKYRVVDAGTPVASTGGNPTEVTAAPESKENSEPPHRVAPGTGTAMTPSPETVPPPPAVNENNSAKARQNADGQKQQAVSRETRPTAPPQQQHTVTPAPPPPVATSTKGTVAQEQPATTPAPRSTPPPAPIREAVRTSQPQPTTAPPASPTAIHGWDPALPDNKPSQQQQDVVPSAADDKTSGPVFVGPKVLLQVMPDTRSLSPGVITELTRVKVEVSIDEKGHVRGAHLLDSPKPQLGTAAMMAAKQWTFQPATLRGQKVPSNHILVFEFTPERASR